MKYDKKNNTLYFSVEELEDLNKKNEISKIVSCRSKKNESIFDIADEYWRKGLSLKDLEKDERGLEMIDKLVKKKNSIKEEIEVFFAIRLSREFYDNSDIGFELDNRKITNIKQIKINTLDDVKNITKEYDLTDFIIGKNEKYRKFQLKQYKGECSTGKVFDFIRRKLLHYCNDIGRVNLLLQLQCGSSGKDIMRIDLCFEEIHNKLKELKFKKFVGQILIRYNNQNKSTIIYQVYPSLIISERKR